MQSALLMSKLDAATVDAPPLNALAQTLLDGADDTKSLPSFDTLASTLGLPGDHSANASEALPTARLPRRVIDGAASDAERALWRAYSAAGIHELLSCELIDALAAHIKARLGAVVLSGLAGRADLNGLRATVLGPVLEGGRVPVRVAKTGECVRAKVANVHGGSSGELPLCLEVGAGCGALAHHLAARLHGWARVVATDNGREPAAAATNVERVERVDAEEALRRHAPQLVLCSWHPSGLDWTREMRSAPSVIEYVLLGEADGSTCGDGWATWGVLPERYDEYGLDEDSVKPHEEDGFVRTTLGDVAKWQACRFDSAKARGFSTCVSFARRSSLPPAEKAGTLSPPIDDDEDLAASWERMQRSLAAGRAQRVGVEMAVDMTRE